MKISIEQGGQSYSALLDSAVSLALPVSNVKRAWYIDEPSFEPVVLGDWTGSVQAGGSVNFFNVGFNPHAHGTHTETAGHILPERHSIAQHFKDHLQLAMVVEAPPVEGVVLWETIAPIVELLAQHNPTAVIIKSVAQPEAPTHQYSNTDWVYLEAKVGEELRNRGVRHLLIDQPSVDQEEDGGALACHRSFWGTDSGDVDLGRTISELLHIPAAVQSGLYLLQMNVSAIDNDAAPSRPIIYPVLP